MLVTIYADASMSGDDVGVAFYLRSALGRITGSVRLPKGKIKTIQEAEAFSILSGLREVNRQWPMASAFVIVNDNMQVVTTLKAHKPGSATTWGRIIEAIYQHLNGRHASFRHVRAHRGGHNVQSWVNEWTDRAARQARLTPIDIKNEI